MIDVGIKLFQSNPIVAIVIALIIIGVVASIVRGLIKIALTLAIIAIVAVVFFGVNPQTVVHTGQQITANATHYYKETLKPIIDKEITNAKYAEDKNGNYKVTTASLTINGKKNDANVTITYNNKATVVDTKVLGDNFKKFIDEQSAKY